MWSFCAISSIFFALSCTCECTFCICVVNVCSVSVLFCDLFFISDICVVSEFIISFLNELSKLGKLMLTSEVFCVGVLFGVFVWLRITTCCVSMCWLWHLRLRVFILWMRGMFFLHLFIVCNLCVRHLWWHVFGDFVNLALSFALRWCFPFYVDVLGTL